MLICFQELLGGVSTITTEEDNFPQLNEEFQNGPFSSDELSTAINNINNGKACGLDEITAEVWKLS